MKHPDDPELWAGGTLALHARDAPVTLAVSEHEAARMAEAAAGALILGVRLRPLPPRMRRLDGHRPPVAVT